MHPSCVPDTRVATLFIDSGQSKRLVTMVRHIITPKLVSHKEDLLLLSKRYKLAVRVSQLALRSPSSSLLPALCSPITLAAACSMPLRGAFNPPSVRLLPPSDNGSSDNEGDNGVCLVVTAGRIRVRVGSAIVYREARLTTCLRSPCQ